MGFEPTTLGTTILYSNQLSYIHHLDLETKSYQPYLIDGAKIHTFFNSPKFLANNILFYQSIFTRIRLHRNASIILSS